MSEGDASTPPASTPPASAPNPNERSVAELIQDHVLPPGQHLERGHGRVARGSMATVEIGVDKSLGRRVALKVMRGDFQLSPLAVRRFIREAQITGQLDHPNIVPIHELAVDEDGRLYFTMKLIEGCSLQVILDEVRSKQVRHDGRGRMLSTALEYDELTRLLELFTRVLDAVAFAHARGVVHCDIKPENIMVGDHGQIYLMDWSIAKVMPTSDAATSTRRVRELLTAIPENSRKVLGTPNYMSPEQARAVREGVDTRSDVFALGAVLFEIVTGHPPYLGDTPEEILELAVACKPVIAPELAIAPELRRIIAVAMHPEPRFRYATVEQLRADLPAGFARVVTKLLAKAPEHRYQTASGLAADLRALRQRLASGDAGEDFALGLEDWPQELCLPHELHGRARERAQLLDDLDQVVRREQLRLVVLAGPPGIGKSALIRDFEGAVARVRSYVAQGRF
ncbi:MAG: serine/threonine-protein kinase PknK, partial [Myxococcales bacterium]|nr:serine/threonine-protein kinase PknK [Myxococcales bacterium]